MIRVELMSSNMLRYHWTSYDRSGRGSYRWESLDLTTLLHNLAVAGALAAAARDGHAKLEHDLRNAQQRCLALEHTAEALAAENAEAKAAVLLQAARLRALESELATLQASVVAALSSAGPGEDERSP